MHNCNLKVGFTFIKVRFKGSGSEPDMGVAPGLTAGGALIIMLIKTVQPSHVYYLGDLTISPW